MIRPFVPNKKNALPPNWRDPLEKWISGTDVEFIRPENLRVIEDAFNYRFVWALEALRSRQEALSTVHLCRRDAGLGRCL